jgi:hypothetical protein
MSFMRPAALFFVLLTVVFPALAVGADPPSPVTVLGVRGTQFTLNGRPTFLLGCSYYAALGAPRDNIRKDLDDLQRSGFNWIRVWATWQGYGKDVSCVDSHGRPRQPFLDNLKWLVAQCDRRGMVVDVTLSRGDGANGTVNLPDMKSHQQAVQTVIDALSGDKNWYLDLSNERNIQDKRFTSLVDLKKLRDLARKADAGLLVTASHSAGLTAKDQAAYVQKVGLDFISYHAARDAKSAAQNERRTERIMSDFPTNAAVPLMYDEPFRRGYADWNPTAKDFATDLAGAKSGHAAGWCFHNGGQANTRDHRPARSFDMSKKRLLDQLDNEERKFLKSLAK